MGFTQRGLQDFSYFEIVQEITLEASLEKVFSACIGDLSPWWGAPYLQDANSKHVILEPRPGGGLFEQWSEEALQCQREGAVYGTVMEIADAELIVIHGPFGMDWPTQSHVRLDFLKNAGKDRATDLKLTHRCYGMISAAQHENFRFGWDDLLNSRLRAWVERGEPLGIGFEPVPWLQGAIPPPADPGLDDGED